MNKKLTYLLAGISMLLFTRCDSLDLEPTSSIGGTSYWKTPDHFSAFNVGMHAMLREKSLNFYLLGEPRADIFGDDPIGGEASQGMERLPFNTINKENVGISNYADMYKNINQLNLMIAKTKETTVLTEDLKNYYLGEAHAMRAYHYFHLLRSWGDVILYLDYTEGQNIDLSNITKPVSPTTAVMEQIKKDIEDSEKAFGDNYSFKLGRHYWSMAATQMLKGEVYLWSGSQMGGGETDYRIAKQAFENVKKADVALIGNFKDVFSYTNKKNKEIIFTIHNGKDEYTLWGGGYSGNLMPAQDKMTKVYCDENGNSFVGTPDAQLNGLTRLQVQKAFYWKGFRKDDTRWATSLKAMYTKKDDKVTYFGPIAYKYQGTMLEGGSQRSYLDDFPIYRYADCLLQLAMAKALLGEDPTAEINAVRERAYGKAYFEANKDKVAYPNDNDTEFYADNKWMKPDNAGAIEAVLKERLREFLFEGKRWYDIRMLGWKYVHQYSLAEENRLLWPIDANTLTNNDDLEQTPGYE
ncbi:SusD family outer membrane lipoprotein NanU [Bacteroides fluxus]|uniref:SusD family outer membrane lipoprotein NanU n=1 Tax=Bacteroides fluxus TaxID=626930 RepID=UPI0023F0B788|nr:SusD family outer membrane lipoprotein NanU [Bacteroides fluxus]